ncbi:reverse transcriptase [Tanacetum coccineum]
MKPATKIASTKNNADTVDDATRRYLDEALAGIRKTMQEMMIMQNQGMNGTVRNQNLNQQFNMMTKVEFPKFLGDDVKGWIFRYEQLFSIDDILENQKIEIGVRMFRPKTLADANCLTNLQEATLEAVRKKKKANINSFVGRFGSGMGHGNNSKPPLLGLPAPNTVVLADEEEEYFKVEEDDEVIPMQDELLQISLNALNESNTFQTMRVTGKVGKHELHILVDCGSTHNFLDDNVAKRIGCQLKDTCHLVVTVGGGKQLISTKECKEFVWQFQGETFKADMMILPLEECEMKNDGSEGGLPRPHYNGWRSMPKELQQVVDQYDDVFAVPKELPPQRSYDHMFPLLEGTQLVNIRPYRHPPTQKDAIEAMLLKKNAFKWTPEAQLFFKALKKAMMKAPVLGFLDFNEPFVIETDASGVGLRAVLQQKGHPIAYLNRHFIIKKDHFNLKYLLDQRITIPTQMKWLPKLIGYDYEVVYKKGSENGAADALYRLGSGIELLSMFVSSITTDLIHRVKATWVSNVVVYAIITSLKNDQLAKKHYAWINEKLLRKGKIVVGHDVNLRRELLQYFYEDSPLEGIMG